MDYLRDLSLAAQYFEQVRSGSEDGYCSAISEAEIWAGHRDSEEELRAAAAISFFTVIPLDSSIARLAGNLLNPKSQGETKAHFRDALIAATAIQQGEPVLTADAASQRIFGASVTYVVYS